MRIDSRDLVGLPVLTESRRRLGKVLSFEIDVDSQAVTLYHVGARHWPGAARYLISPRQVASVTAEEMVVFDAAVREREAEARAIAAPAATISPVASSQRD
ncbi:hypothetical protein EPN90_03685 [Patescibacteria group bacterium]|nr:MAG: hypothetical protein EPN90_03685 [Patescibacteria group bacterium]